MEHLSQHLAKRQHRAIGFAKGEFITLLPLQPPQIEDPWKGEVTRDPLNPNIFRRPFFTEGEYQRHIERRKAYV